MNRIGRTTDGTCLQIADMLHTIAGRSYGILRSPLVIIFEPLPLHLPVCLLAMTILFYLVAARARQEAGGAGNHHSQARLGELQVARKPKRQIRCITQLDSLTASSCYHETSRAAPYIVSGRPAGPSNIVLHCSRNPSQDAQRLGTTGYPLEQRGANSLEVNEVQERGKQRAWRLRVQRATTLRERHSRTTPSRQEGMLEVSAPPQQQCSVCGIRTAIRTLLFVG